RGGRRVGRGIRRRGGSRVGRRVRRRRGSRGGRSVGGGFGRGLGRGVRGRLRRGRRGGRARGLRRNHIGGVGQNRHRNRRREGGAGGDELYLGPEAGRQGHKVEDRDRSGVGKADEGRIQARNLEFIVADGGGGRGEIEGRAAAVGHVGIGTIEKEREDHRIPLDLHADALDAGAK